MNRVELHGTIYGDPDLRYTERNTSWCRFRIRVTDKSSFGLVAFGSLASRIGQMAAGDPIHATGRLQNRKRTVDGREQWELQIVAESIEGDAPAAPADGESYLSADIPF